MTKDTVNLERVRQRLRTSCRDYRTYLNYNPNQNKSLVLPLCAHTLPPDLEAKSPILGTPPPFPFGKKRAEQLIPCDERRLPATDNEQLLVVSLVQADPNRQVQAHAPVFHLAGERAVHGVDEKARKGEDVHGEQGQQHERDVADPEDGMLAVDPGEDAGRVEEERVEGPEDDVGDAVAVEVLGTEIEAAGVEVDHFWLGVDGALVEGGEGCF